MHLDYHYFNTGVGNIQPAGPYKACEIIPVLVMAHGQKKIPAFFNK